MEAKGCAKPMVWQDSRRRFYWAVRARVARSRALARLAEAKPSSTHEYRSSLLDSLACIDAAAENRTIAESLEQLDISKTLTQLKVDHLWHSLLEMINQDRKATVDNLLNFVDELSEEEKGRLGSALQSTSDRSREC
jgi:acetyl-CoA carboxylase/biotin carboxylase 1